MRIILFIIALSLTFVGCEQKDQYRVFVRSEKIEVTLDYYSHGKYHDSVTILVDSDFKPKAFSFDGRCEDIVPYIKNAKFTMERSLYKTDVDTFKWYYNYGNDLCNYLLLQKSSGTFQYQ